MIGRHTGLRYGDVATLAWSEVHFDKGYLLLKPNKTRRFKVEVCIPMVPELKDALLEAQKKCKGDFVLPLHAELYGTRSGTAHKMLNFREVLDLAGVKGDEYTFHSWRHTLRSRLADSGASIETAKRLLGQSSDEMSVRYDHSAHVDESLKALLAAR
jgi:integrase